MKTKVSNKAANEIVNNVYDLNRLYDTVEYGDFSIVSDAELVYAIIGNEKDFNEAAGREDLNIIDILFRMNACDLAQLPGIGKKKAVQIASMAELARRKANIRESKAVVDSSLKAYEEFRHIQDLDREEIWYILENNRGQIIEKRRLNAGTSRDCSFDDVEILKRAILKKAYGVILAHNHPSGNLKPSIHDDHMTQEFKAAAKTMGIKLLDHIIVGGNRYFSYADEGRI